MKNEFIVWDKYNKKFTNKNFILANGRFEDDFYEHEVINELFSFHQYINKKDINNKKIYADCSIVEFEYEVGNAKHIGFFYYNEYTLGYKIKILSSILNNKASYKFKGLSWCFTADMINLNIVDSIQENKLGLSKG